MKSALTIIAGPTALRHLQRNGLQADDIKVVVAASGGPKWFILKALDQYLFGEFFKDRQKTLHTLGSSAGAWQMACFAQKDPVAAVQRLADFYSQETYSEKPGPQEVTDKARILVKRFLGENGAAEIAGNPVIQTHILTNRCIGLVGRESRGLQLTGLVLAATANLISRKTLRLFFERLVMHAGEQSFFRFNDHPTQTARLTPTNVEDALMASGSIPLVLSGVTAIEGAPPGMYRDGGIVDYHFDVPFLAPQEGLVIYPHFSHTVTPGWFDKILKYRKVNPRHYDNVVLLTPSRELVSQLPYGKISDRKDFQHLDAVTRLKYWNTVIHEGERIAQALAELVHNGRGMDSIQAFPAV
jgi:hypothetical protein